MREFLRSILTRPRVRISRWRAPQTWYAPPIEEYQQGDIVRMSPSAFFRDRPIFAVRRRNDDGVRVNAGLHAEDRVAPKDGFRWDEDQEVVIQGRQTYAMVLTHDCDIVNPEKGPHRLLGLIRPWSNVPPEDQLKIASQQVFRFFYLAETTNPVAFGPAYVDFRRLTTVHKDVLRDADRLVSVSEPVRQALREALVRFFARAEE